MIRQNDVKKFVKDNGLSLMDSCSCSIIRFNENDDGFLYLIESNINNTCAVQACESLFYRDGIICYCGCRPGMIISFDELEKNFNEMLVEYKSLQKKIRLSRIEEL